MRKVLLTLMVLAGSSAVVGRTDAVTTVSDTNAALRYWMAFAALQNPPADESTVRLLDDVAAGSAEWDEARLGPILDRNSEALGILRRATSLSQCSWGLEVELGPEAPMQHLGKARALARLNVLHGARARARGGVVEAIDTWLAGVRFARHLGQDVPLTQVLVAGASLSANLRQIERALGDGRIDPAALGRIEHELRALPPYALDWPQAWTLEEGALNVWLERLAQGGGNELVRQIAGAEQPTSAERQRVAKELGLSEGQLDNAAAVRGAVLRLRPEMHSILTALVAASRLPYTQASARLTEIDAALATASPVIRRVVPSPTRANQARAELEAHRAGVLGLVVLTQQRVKSGRDVAALTGLSVPDDPFSDRPFEVLAADGGLELRSSGRDGKGQPLVYRLKR
jgi:hypothetical protein